RRFDRERTDRGPSQSLPGGLRGIGNIPGSMRDPYRIHSMPEGPWHDRPREPECGAHPCWIDQEDMLTKHSHVLLLREILIVDDVECGPGGHIPAQGEPDCLRDVVYMGEVQVRIQAPDGNSPAGMGEPCAEGARSQHVIGPIERAGPKDDHVRRWGCGRHSTEQMFFRQLGSQVWSAG